MIAVKLRDAMERYRMQTGKRITYRELAGVTGVSESTLQSIAARRDYNTTLDTVDRIATALRCPLEVLLEHLPESPASAPTEAGAEEETRFGC